MTELIPVDHDPFENAQPLPNASPWPAPQQEPEKGFWGKQWDQFKKQSSDLYHAVSDAPRLSPVVDAAAMVQEAREMPWETSPEEAAQGEREYLEKHGKESLGQKLTDFAESGAPMAFTGIFAGPKSNTADLKALNYARFSERLGTHPETIWKETGWFRGPDDRWRYEIQDPEIGTAYWPGSVDRRFMDEGVSLEAMRRQGIRAELQDVLEHPELYKAYPELKKMVWSALPENRMPPGAQGAYNPGQQGPGSIDVLNKISPNLQKGYSTTMHEGQHAIQDIEGFEPGGNAGMFKPEHIAAERARMSALQSQQETPEVMSGWGSIAGGVDPYSMTDQEVAYNLYRRLAGEAEARAVQERLKMTPEERRNTPPWQTKGIPAPEDQIVFNRWNPGRAAGGTVQKPKGYPHARYIDGKWLIPDAKNPGSCCTV